jgi:hypothetical protein
MPISAHKLCRLAAELASEHGLEARDYARRAYLTLEAEGDTERAHFWFTLSILVDDVVMHRLDLERPPTIH